MIGIIDDEITECIKGVYGSKHATRGSGTFIIKANKGYVELIILDANTKISRFILSGELLVGDSGTSNFF